MRGEGGVWCAEGREGKGDVDWGEGRVIYLLR